MSMWDATFNAEEMRAFRRALDAARPVAAVHIGESIHMRLEAYYALERIRSEGLLLVTPRRAPAPMPPLLGVPRFTIYPTDDGFAFHSPINSTRPVIVAALRGFSCS